MTSADTASPLFGDVEAGNHLDAPQILPQQPHNDIKALAGRDDATSFPLSPTLPSQTFIISTSTPKLPKMSFQGHSNVGFPSLYESQNQKNHKQSEVDELKKHTGENLKGFLHSRSISCLHAASEG
jgi:hypothetical protein